MAEENDGQFDFEAFKQVKDHAQELQNQHRERCKIAREMDNLYWMDWAEESDVKRQIDNVKITRSPRARIDIQGAMRLLGAADPQFNVPFDLNNAQVSMVANKLERFANAMWFASGRITGDPIHYDVIRSGLLYSEIHLRISSTKELLKYAKGSNPAMVARAEYVAEKTPYLFEPTNPQEGYPEFGPLGLQLFYRRVKTTSGYVMDNWGSRGVEALRYMQKLDPKQRYTEVVLNDVYDLRDRWVWLDGCDRPILQQEHGLVNIPVVAQLVEGSRMFSKPEKQREPFLYTLYKSGLINRQNLFLTVFYTLIFAVGANPMFVNYLIDPDNPPAVDYSKPGGQVNMRVGERREPMVKNVIDPSMMQGWNIANELEQESTIYRQTLGEPLGQNAPYSMVALLSQSGRLPLTMQQRKGGWAIAEAAQIAFNWMRAEKGSYDARHEQYDETLEASEIPKHFEITANLEISLPQDRLNAANAANALAAGDNPMVSKRWVRENVLNIGQSDIMNQEIWREKVADLHYQQFVFQMMAAIEQAKQMALQPGQAGGMPAPGAMPPGMPMQPGMGAPGMASPAQPQPVSPVEPMNPLEPYQPLPPNAEALT